jgi:hypothetical protein
MTSARRRSAGNGCDIRFRPAALSFNPSTALIAANVLMPNTFEEGFVNLLLTLAFRINGENFTKLSVVWRVRGATKSPPTTWLV